jgi:hypothetical protein
LICMEIPCIPYYGQGPWSLDSNMTIRKMMVALMAALVLLLMLPGVAFGLTEHCPDHNGNPNKVEGEYNSLVLPAGTEFCVKASNEATGVLTADGVKSLIDYVASVGIVNGQGHPHDVSYYVTYPTVPPVVDPPVVDPPVVDPPVTEPPVVEPPVTEPPVIEPPVDPPVVEPPVVDECELDERSARGDCPGEEPSSEPPVDAPPPLAAPAPTPVDEPVEELPLTGIPAGLLAIIGGGMVLSGIKLIRS